MLRHFLRVLVGAMILMMIGCPAVQSAGVLQTTIGVYNQRSEGIEAISASCHFDNITQGDQPKSCDNYEKIEDILISAHGAMAGYAAAIAKLMGAKPPGLSGGVKSLLGVPTALGVEFDADAVSAASSIIDVTVGAAATEYKAERFRTAVVEVDPAVRCALGSEFRLLRHTYDRLKSTGSYLRGYITRGDGIKEKAFLRSLTRIQLSQMRRRVKGLTLAVAAVLAAHKVLADNHKKIGTCDDADVLAAAKSAAKIATQWFDKRADAEKVIPGDADIIKACEQVKESNQ